MTLPCHATSTNKPPPDVTSWGVTQKKKKVNNDQSNKIINEIQLLQNIATIFCMRNYLTFKQLQNIQARSIVSGQLLLT